jgi:hypothetical protein
MHIRRTILLALVLCCVGAVGAWGQSSLHMGSGAGTPCATGCGGHPNLFVGAKTVDIYQTSNGASLSSQPVLLIFGVPTDFSDLFPLQPVKGVRAINPYPGGTQTNGTVDFAAGGSYGLIDPISDGFFGTMMPGQEVYSFLNLGGANNSNSFTNWADADEEYLGLNPVGFDIHVYAVNADLGPHGLINLKLAVNVPKGTFILAYSQTNGKTYSVPFTEAGLKCTY